MLGLRTRKSPLIGVDLSPGSVKLLELRRLKSGAESAFQVESYAVEPLPTGAIVEKKIVDPEAVGDAIKRALKRSGSKARRAAIAVSDASVISKVVTVPASLTDREMEEQIYLEADQYIPYALDDVNLDFSVIGPSGKGGDLVDVLLVASRRENIADRLWVLQVAGLTADVIDVEGCAISNACEVLIGELASMTRQKQPFALADIGASAIAVNVFGEGRVLYSREQAFGGDQLTEEIARHYDLSTEQAVVAKRKGGLPASYQTEVLAPFMESVAQQISRALQFFYAASAQKKIDLLILSGGSANLPNIDTLIGERINAQTLIAQPFAGMKVSPGVDSEALLADGPSLLVAAGLALRGLD